MSSDVLYLVLPAYNEEETLTNVLNQWYPIVERHFGDGNSRLFVLDDGSKDHTKEILEAYGKQHPLMEYRSRTNKGHGPTVREAYAYALEQGADYVFQTDSDGQTLPEEFEGFWTDREKYDMIIGKRYDRKDGKSRIFVTKTLRNVLRLKFHVSIEDANTPYRLMNSRSLEDLLPVVEEMDPLTNVSLSVLYAKSDYTVCFKPITFLTRQGGINSINFKKIIKIGKKSWKDFGALKKRMKEKFK